MSTEVITTETTDYAKHALELIYLLSCEVESVCGIGMQVKSFTEICLSDNLKNVAAQEHPKFLDVVYKYFINMVLNQNEKSKLAQIFHSFTIEKHDWVYYFNSKFQNQFPPCPVDEPEEFLLIIIEKISLLKKGFDGLYWEQEGCLKVNIKGPSTNFEDLLVNIMNKMSARLDNLKGQIQVF
jgi:hypothetical protein